MKRHMFEYAGIVASVVLVAFGIGSIVTGLNGRHTVRHELASQQIVGTPDMTPAGIKSEAAKAGLKNLTDIPTCTVANQKINTGSKARCFAQYMRIHALEATGGQVYAQMGRFLDKNGKATNDQAAAAIDPKTKQPVENGARNLWVTETALTNALNTSFFAEQVAMFGLVVGVAFLLAGIGFAILAFTAFRWLPAREAAGPSAAKASIGATPKAT